MTRNLNTPPDRQECAASVLADLFTTASALSHQRRELAQIADSCPMDAGLRDTLIALIERNQELVDAVATFINDKLPKELMGGVLDAVQEAI